VTEPRPDTADRSGAPDLPRDAHLLAALRHAPDAAAPVDPALRERILERSRERARAARGGARHRPASRLTRWLDRLRPGSPWGAAFASVALGTVIVMAWRGGPSPEAPPAHDTVRASAGDETMDRREARRVAAAPLPEPTYAATVPAPAPAPPPAAKAVPARPSAPAEADRERQARSEDVRRMARQDGRTDAGRRSAERMAAASVPARVALAEPVAAGAPAPSPAPAPAPAAVLAAAPPALPVARAAAGRPAEVAEVAEADPLAGWREIDTPWPRRLRELPPQGWARRPADTVPAHALVVPHPDAGPGWLWLEAGDGGTWRLRWLPRAGGPAWEQALPAGTLDPWLAAGLRPPG
jgi:pyruvate/2-oxoglutarate dehydrogenase complex dihydrolipoamide acyltransferase (E2) component